MSIGVDVDGVLTNLEQWQLTTCGSYAKRKVVNPNAYDAKKIYDLTDQEYNSLLSICLSDYAVNEPARTGASELLKKLREEGNKIIIVTGRLHTTEDSIEGEKQRKYLLDWLSKNNIEYDDIIFTSPDDDKLNILLENNISIMIEDSETIINTLSSNLDVICFDAKYNQSCSGNNIYRVYSWYDIYYTLEELSCLLK